MITHEIVRPCIGKWVVCHTRHGDLTGRLQTCHPTHLVLAVPRRPMRLTTQSAQDETTAAHAIARVNGAQDGRRSGESGPAAELAMWGWGGYGGYGGYGFASTAVPLAAVLGLTLIGASALWW